VNSRIVVRFRADLFWVAVILGDSAAPVSGWLFGQVAMLESTRR
jgi:hypothetical protein